MNACGDPLDKHHVFGGALRSKSERYGLTVYLHHNKCHIFGAQSAHKNAVIDRALKQRAQNIAMKHYSWSADEWLGLFYKNYL